MATTRTALIILFSALLLAYAPVIFLNRSQMPALFYPNAPEGPGPHGYLGRKPVNTFNADLSDAYAGWPGNRLSGKLWRSGETPLWNPYQGTGVPIAAQTYWSTFFPLQILEDIAPYCLWDFFILVRLLIAGAFTFLFLKEIKSSYLGALFGALVYMFSGIFIWFFHLEPLTNVAMMTPVLFFSSAKALNAATWSRMALLAIAFGFTMLSGTPTVIVYVMLGWIVYLILEIWHRRVEFKNQPLIKIGVFVTAIFSGLTLASVLLMPLAEYLPLAYDYRTSELGLGAQRINFFYLLFQIFPSLSEFDLGNFALNLKNGIWDYAGGALGMIPAFVIAYAFITAIKKRKWDFYFLVFLSIGLVILLKNFGVPPFLWLGKAPILNKIWSPRWSGIIWSFALTIAAARGFNLLTEENGSGTKQARELKFSRRFKLFAINALIFIGSAVAAYLALQTIADLWLPEFDPQEGYLIAKPGKFLFALKLIPLAATFGILPIIIRLLRGQKLAFALISISFLDLWLAIPRGYAPATIFLITGLYILGLAAVFLISSQKNSPNWKMPAISGALFLLIFLAIDFSAAKGLPARVNPFSEPPFIKFLKALPDYEMYRAMSADGALMPNLASAYNIFSLEYINALTPMVFHEFRKDNLEHYCPVGESSSSLWMTGVNYQYLRGGIAHDCIAEKELRARLPFYSLLGVRYLITPNSKDLNDPLYFPLIYKGEVNIFENRQALPRVFLAREFKRANNLQESKRLTSELALGLKKIAVLEEDIPFPENDAPKAGEKLTIADSKPNRIEIKALLESPALAVLTDTSFPGWKTYIDGEEAKTLRVDGLFRGVAVPAGSHTIIWSYEPKSFSNGLAATFGSAVLILSAAIIAKKIGVQTPQFSALILLFALNSALLWPYINLGQTYQTQTKIEAGKRHIEASRKLILDSVYSLTLTPWQLLGESYTAWEPDTVGFSSDSLDNVILSYRAKNSSGLEQKIFAEAITKLSSGEAGIIYRGSRHYFEYVPGSGWRLKTNNLSEELLEKIIKILELPDRPLSVVFQFDFTSKDFKPVIFLIWANAVYDKNGNLVQHQGFLPEIKTDYRFFYSKELGRWLNSNHSWK